MRKNIALETGERVFQRDGCMESVFPPESFFGFSYWSLMVPPFKPQNMLILGYGNGTISALTKKIWGDVKITGVDLECPTIKYDKDDVLIMNAYDFVTQYAEKHDPFDYIVVDLYKGNEIVSLVYEESFIRKLHQVCSLRLAINIHNKDLAQGLDADGKSVYEKYFRLEVAKPLMGQTVIFFKKDQA